MLTLIIHLAVAKKYLENHPEEDIKSFISGSIAPDFGYDKISNHYGTYLDNYKNINEYIESNVNLNEYLKINRLDNSYNRGYFLHLLGDYIFYNNYLNNDINEEIFSKLNIIVKEDLNLLSTYIIDKYDLTIPEIVKDVTTLKQGNTKLINKEDIDKLIIRLSNIDLTLYKNKTKIKEK